MSAILCTSSQVKVSDTEYAFVKVFQPLPYTGRPPEARRGGCARGLLLRLFLTCVGVSLGHAQVTAITTGHTADQALDV